MTAYVLELKGVGAGYGKKQVIHGVDWGLVKGKIHLLLGHNGAGKTTLFRAIAGLQRASSGAILYKGSNIVGRTAAQNVDVGIAFVPQGHGVFRTLSVQENLDLGAFTERDSKAIEQSREMILELFPILKDRTRQLAGTMSGGQQQMLALGMALMHRPELLILDEPSIGLAPNFVDRVIECVKTINSQLGVTIIMAEQNIQASLPIADEVVIIRTGGVVYRGGSESLRDHVNLMKYF